MTEVYVDRRHIAYRPPFHVEAFKTGFVIGCDANGLNCVRFTEAPLALGTDDPDWMERCVAALNEQPVSEIIKATAA